MESSSRSFRRNAIIAGLILLAIAVDAVAGFNLIMAAGCITFFVVQLLAMTAGSVLAVIGLVVWIFSRFRSREALGLAASALALAVAALLLNHAVAWMGLGCVD
jgi:hypothetical protein